MISTVQGTRRALSMIEKVAAGLDVAADTDPTRVDLLEAFETLLSAVAGDFEMIPFESVTCAAVAYFLGKQQGG